jgi:hypothetical protein
VLRGGDELAAGRGGLEDGLDGIDIRQMDLVDGVGNPIESGGTINVVEGAGKLTIEAGGTFSQSEINAAKYMQSLGNNVELRMPVGTRAGGGTSDLLVNGINYDVYTPTTSNVSRIIGSMAGKNSQTTGIVLDLSQTSVTAGDLGNALTRVQGSIKAGGTVPNITDIVIMPK